MVITDRELACWRDTASRDGESAHAGSEYTPFSARLSLVSHLAVKSSIEGIC